MTLGEKGHLFIYASVPNAVACPAAGVRVPNGVRGNHEEVKKYNRDATNKLRSKLNGKYVKFLPVYYFRADYADNWKSHWLAAIRSAIENATDVTKITICIIDGGGDACDGERAMLRDIETALSGLPGALWSFMADGQGWMTGATRLWNSVTKGDQSVVEFKTVQAQTGRKYLQDHLEG